MGGFLCQRVAAPSHIRCMRSSYLIESNLAFASRRCRRSCSARRRSGPRPGRTCQSSTPSRANLPSGSSRIVERSDRNRRKPQLAERLHARSQDTGRGSDSSFLKQTSNSVGFPHTESRGGQSYLRLGAEKLMSEGAVGRNGSKAKGSPTKVAFYIEAAPLPDPHCSRVCCIST